MAFNAREWAEGAEEHRYNGAARANRTPGPPAQRSGEGPRGDTHAGDHTLGDLPGMALDEVDAAALAAAGPANAQLDYLPLLGQDGYLVRGWSHMLAGYPRAGKTELLAACCREWLVRGEKVLYITEEPRTLWACRLARTPDAWQGMRLLFGLGTDPEVLRKRLRSGHETIVILDTVRGLGILRADECDNSLVAMHLTPFIAAAREQGKTLLLCHHMRKGAGEHGEGVAGGHALLGCVDIAIELRRDPAPDRRLLRCYCRIISPPDLLYERQADGTMRALGAAAAVEVVEVRARVRDAVEGDWLKTAEVRDRLDEPRPGLEQVRQALLAEAEAGNLERDPPLSAGRVPGKAVRWRRPATASVDTASVDTASVDTKSRPPTIGAYSGRSTFWECQHSISPAAASVDTASVDTASVDTKSRPPTTGASSGRSTFRECQHSISPASPPPTDPSPPASERDRHQLVELVEWIERRGGTVTAREVQGGCRRLRGPGAAEAALEELARAGQGHWKMGPPPATGGQPCRVFVLSDDAQGGLFSEPSSAGPYDEGL
jgi:hypothetical protein